MIQVACMDGSHSTGTATPHPPPLLPTAPRQATGFTSSRSWSSGSSSSSSMRASLACCTTGDDTACGIQSALAPSSVWQPRPAIRCHSLGNNGSSGGGGGGGQLAIPAAAAAAGSCRATPTGWHPLDHPLIWKGTEEHAVLRQATPYPLSPSWKVILLSDGSVTRHLQLMTNERVQVECLEMREIGHERAGLPPQAAAIEGLLVQRQVLLHIPDPHSKAYVYATSWWSAATVDEYLKDRSEPIWVSLSQKRTELYREILQLELGNCPYLEERFQARGPFWGRQYLFWHGGKPLTLIYEVFSTELEQFMGSPHQVEG